MKDLEKGRQAEGAGGLAVAAIREVPAAVAKAVEVEAATTAEASGAGGGVCGIGFPEF